MFINHGSTNFSVSNKGGLDSLLHDAVAAYNRCTNFLLGVYQGIDANYDGGVTEFGKGLAAFVRGPLKQMAVVAWWLVKTAGLFTIKAGAAARQWHEKQDYVATLTETKAKAVTAKAEVAAKTDEVINTASVIILGSAIVGSIVQASAKSTFSAASERLAALNSKLLKGVDTFFQHLFSLV